MNVEALKLAISDLIGVEPRSIASDRSAAEAAVWVEMEQRSEADAESMLGPAIKLAYTEHKRLTSEKKSMLEKLLSAKARVRAGLANWIAAGHAVDGCYVKTSYRVIVTDPDKVPDEYTYRAIDEEKLAKWAEMTEGAQAVPGCVIEPVRVLYKRAEAGLNGGAS